ncbi:MAG: EFR1 family ferrodoxin [Treponema sp.]|nr:EFR1 family ferrodoxin [Spirochaetia bacterium]MDD7458942.1 EFR1 family ferrodoxin [Spirochaetales bacterium]MDY5811002.1 EFR1 family ferrodoxin [Treponema sp.]
MNIIYFSGSGNTEYCASLFSEFTGGKMCSIEDKEEAREIIKLSETFAIAYPIHYSNMPFIVKDFIKENGTLFKGKKIFLMATMGMFSGDGTGCGARLLKKYGAEIIGGMHVQMPDSIGDVNLLKRNKQTNRAIINSAEKKIKAVSEMLHKNKLPKEGLHFYNHIAGLFGQRLWFLHHVKKLRTALKVDSNKCTGCGFCAAHCPTSSLVLQNGKAALKGTGCTICYRCMNSCPSKAITIIGKKVYEQCLFKYN